MTDDVDTDRYATPDGPLSETTLTCPWCDFEATGEDYNDAQRIRFDHVRDEHREGQHADIGAKLKRHDREADDE